MVLSRFQFLSHDEFFALSQEAKSAYLIQAVKELAKMQASAAGANTPPAGSSTSPAA